MSLPITTRRQVGNTPLHLPVFGFGTTHLGEFYAKVKETDSRATLDAAWEAGIRYYDTAPWYGLGLAEHRLGGFLRTQPRSEFQITSKVGRILKRPVDPRNFDRSPWLGGLNFEVHFDYSYDGIMRAYSELLQRLALDTVDALVIHDLDASYHSEEILERHQKDLRETGVRALAELKRAGDIKAYGMGINTDQALETVTTQIDLDFCLVAMPYTLIDQASLHTGMATCVKRGVSIIIGAPFASGILVTGSGSNAKYGYASASPMVQAKVRGIEAVGKAHGVSLPSAALQFVLAHPAVVAVVSGAVRPTEIMENVKSSQAVVPNAFWSDLKTRGLIDPLSPTPSD